MDYELRPFEKCPYCYGDIFVSPNATSVRCKFCHKPISVNRFTREEKQVAEKITQLQEQLGTQLSDIQTEIDSMKNEWRTSLNGQLQELFRQGENYQFKWDFASAIIRYEVLLIKNTFPESEVHWRILLCRYGIVYTPDPFSNHTIPTITDYGINYIRRQQQLHQHQSIFSASPNGHEILDEQDYQLAVEYAPDEDIRSFYEEEIQRIQAVILKALSATSGSSVIPTPSTSAQFPASKPSPAFSQAEVENTLQYIKEILRQNVGNRYFSMYDWVPTAEDIWEATQDDRFGALLLGYYVAVLKNHSLAMNCYRQLCQINTPRAQKAISAPFIRAFIGI